ncbi:amidohydrolase [uncultured Clostridium sp.]|uniref:amidohydrolase n=1 Tax=uncultured Clostridium sp. TaxID=59620 RepID=UPI0025F554B0|nr:amidohydrolase [uncultured Clostridium sp.]
MGVKENICKFVEEKKDLFIGVSEQVWENPELGFEEFKSSDIIIDALIREDFQVERGIAGIGTAFRGTFGHGSPVIGFLGEYDALPSLSQQAMTAVKRPVSEGAAGHGCGHNALGAGSLAAAVAFKDYLKETGLTGTVVYLGCPAEESGCGKAFMAREGIFDSLDAALTWHPDSCTGIFAASSLADYCVLFKFKGVSAHAASSPHLGRSALDAAELMNVGVNFLREHIIDQARIHYAFLDTGGSAPNVVQDSATLYYYIRAPKNSQIMEIYPRVVKVAQGAAMMTETTLTVEVKSALSDYIPNRILSSVMGECNLELGGIQFSRQAEEFAAAMTNSISVEDKGTIFEHLTMYCEPEAAASLTDRVLLGKAFGYHPLSCCLPGSTDVGDVSYIVPTAQMVATTAVLGTPEHSWQLTAQANSPIAHEGLLYAGKVMAYTACRLLEEPELLEKAKAELKATVPGGYVCPIPPEVTPEAQSQTD